MKKTIINLIFLIAIMAVGVSAANYIPTNAQDFDVWISPEPDLDGYVYATVNLPAINGTLLDYSCVTSLYAVENATGKYWHMQSNPPSAKSGLFSAKLAAVTPEEKGYFPIEKGIGTVYFRSKGVVGYQTYLFVVQCSNAGGMLTYEERVTPNWRQFGTDLPMRIVWFNQNAMYIILALIVVAMILMFVWAKWKG